MLTPENFLESTAFVHPHIVQGFADATFLYAWAESFDHDYEDVKHEKPWPKGSDISKYAPATPVEVLAYARHCFHSLHTFKNWNITQAYYDNAANGVHVVPPTLYKFGWALGAELQGVGSSWVDDHPDHPFCTSGSYDATTIWLDSADYTVATLYFGFGYDAVYDVQLTGKHKEP